MPRQGRTPRALAVILAAAIGSATIGAVVAGVALGAGTIGSIDSAATATAPANRGLRHRDGEAPGVPPVLDGPALAGCDVTLLRSLSTGDPSAGQWIMVTVPSATSTSGTLAIAT